MVNIKGLDKARVLKALYDHSHVQGSGFLQAVPDGVVTVEHCEMLLGSQTYFDYLHRRVMKVELSGDEFDERLYDRDCGEGAAQRAVDSIRDEQAGSEDTAGGASGEKKELTMEEKVEQVKGAIDKILGILTELPPDVSAATCTMLKMTLPGPMGGMAGLMMMGGPFSPSALFRSVEKPMGLADWDGAAWPVRIKENAPRKPPTACAGRTPRRVPMTIKYTTYCTTLRGQIQGEKYARGRVSDLYGIVT